MPDPARHNLRLEGDRKAFRDGAIRAFLAENPGTGIGDLTSRNIYEVERSLSGHSVELHRPAYLNNGMDFTVQCPSIVFAATIQKRWRCVPRHDHLSTIFSSLRRKYPRKYEDVQRALENAYLCKHLGDLKTISQLVSKPLVPNEAGCPADLAVLIARWLFVEQDVTYWHCSGRAMLFGKLQKDGCV